MQRWYKKFWHDLMQRFKKMLSQVIHSPDAVRPEDDFKSARMTSLGGHDG